jgi:hypothetical protein
MKNLAEDWEAFTQREKGMMLKALNWYLRARSRKEVHAGTLAFVDRDTVSIAVAKYVDNIILSFTLVRTTQEHEWNRLANYLKFGPYVRRASQWEKEL